MLVLTRKKNEEITVGDDVVFTILEIRGDKVRVGVEAPKSVGVHRREVYELIKRRETTGGHGQDANMGSEALPPASEGGSRG